MVGCSWFTPSCYVAAQVGVIGDVSASSKWRMWSWSPWLRGSPWLPWTLGPIGNIQPFETQHGEWGPPVGRISDIDWEIYSLWLIFCDLLLSGAWHVFAGSALYGIRLKSLSPTFRFSMGYIFGTSRLVVVLYFFRAKPTALYIYLHFFSFCLHLMIGMVALLFNEGPWKALRPNKFGMYERHPLNPYSAVPTLFAYMKSLAEHCLWGIMQLLVQTLYEAKSSAMSRRFPFPRFQLMPSAMLHEMGSRLPSQLSEPLTWFKESPYYVWGRGVEDEDDDDDNEELSDRGGGGTETARRRMRGLSDGSGEKRLRPRSSSSGLRWRREKGTRELRALSAVSDYDNRESQSVSPQWRSSSPRFAPSSKDQQFDVLSAAFQSHGFQARPRSASPSQPVRWGQSLTARSRSPSNITPTRSRANSSTSGSPVKIQRRASCHPNLLSPGKPSFGSTPPRSRTTSFASAFSTGNGDDFHVDLDTDDQSTGTATSMSSTVSGGGASVVSTSSSHSSPLSESLSLEELHIGCVDNVDNLQLSGSTAVMECDYDSSGSGDETTNADKNGEILKDSTAQGSDNGDVLGDFSSVPASLKDDSMLSLAGLGSVRENVAIDDCGFEEANNDKLLPNDVENAFREGFDANAILVGRRRSTSDLEDEEDPYNLSPRESDILENTAEKDAEEAYSFDYFDEQEEEDEEEEEEGEVEEVDARAEDESWIFAAEEEASENLMLLQGPGAFRLTVSPAKWNESRLFWARPQLESFFLNGNDEHEGDEDEGDGQSSGLGSLGRKHAHARPRHARLGTAGQQRTRSISTESASASEQMNEKDAVALLPDGIGVANTSYIDEMKKKVVLSVDISDIEEEKNAERKRESVTASADIHDDDVKVDTQTAEENSDSVSAKHHGAPTASLSPGRVPVATRTSSAPPVSPRAKQIVMKDSYSDVRGLMSLRGDGILLTISPVKPNLRMVVMTGLQSQSEPAPMRQAIVELVGRHVRCQSGHKVFYMYAEFPKYNMKLNAKQRTTMLWLLNTLNGVTHGVVELRAYRCASFTDVPGFLARDAGSLTAAQRRQVRKSSRQQERKRLVKGDAARAKGSRGSEGSASGSVDSNVNE